MRQHGWACLVVWGDLLASGPRAPAREAPPSSWRRRWRPHAEQALADLERALRARRPDVARRKSLPVGGPLPVVVGVADKAAVDRLLAAHRIDLPKEAEALCIRKLCESTRPVLLIVGRDPRGLGYALAEVARAVELVNPSKSSCQLDTSRSRSSRRLSRSRSSMPFTAVTTSSLAGPSFFWPTRSTTSCACFSSPSSRMAR